MAKYLLLILFLAVAGGVVYLALSTVPAPTKPVTKPIPAERYAQQ
jgi:hypothetical protein